MSPRLLIVLICLTAGGAQAAWAQTLERFALVIGANSGGPDRPRLRYAVADAERFARVIGELGGVAEANEVVLRDPKVGVVLRALADLRPRLRAANAVGRARTEVFVYYSGHADESGLLLGEDRLSYATLREQLDELPADVRIAVLDACASGAFTRTKGGKRRPPFLVDESSAMRGYAFITSSAANEAAQESDRIQASYFTHYLVSGFRGAADASGDGRVTLNEAYQFAFAETLGRTVDTRGGAQHPTYEINLAGAGDVVITDVRQTTARLVLEEAIEGRVFVRTASRVLVAELYKPAGREVEIALEPGTYDVKVDQGPGARAAVATLADRSRAVIRLAQMAPAQTEPARRRGAEVDSYALAGAHRLVFQSGLWGTNGEVISVAGTGFDVTGGGQYAYQWREDLAFTVGVTGYGAEAQVDVIGGLAIPIGVQWNPLRSRAADHRVKPFLAAGIVPVTSADSEGIGSSRRYSVGATVGAGLDLHVSRSFAVGASANFNAIPAFTRPAGRHDTFHGPELSLRVSWIIARGR